MTFGEAIEALKLGLLVQRVGWNGKGMFLVLATSDGFLSQTKSVDKLYDYPTQPFIAMRTVDGTLVPWLASQTDMLAEDWAVL